jgi:hypothetical protein
MQKMSSKKTLKQSPGKLNVHGEEGTDNEAFPLEKGRSIVGRRYCQ